MGLSLTIADIYVENRKIFPPSCILRPAQGVPLGIGYRRKVQKKLVMGYQLVKKVL